MSDGVEVKQGIVYGASGQLLDVYRAPAGGPAQAPVVLLWHGRGPAERDVLAPLARTVAARGVTVMVPDWRSDAADGGWGHLTESVAFVRKHAGEYGGDADRIVLAGWSLGALAGAGLILRPERTEGWRPMAFVGIAGKYLVDKPEMGMRRSPLEELTAGATFPGPVELVHGTGDDIVGPQESREFRDALAGHGHRVTLTEVDADHAGVVMTEFSPSHDRCLPARSPAALHAGQATAAALTRATDI
jgi:predicted esterase